MSGTTEPYGEEVPPPRSVRGRPRRVVVLGGGITGLTAAYEAARLSKDVEVVLLEAASRPGGKVLTEERHGAVVELGPDSFVTAKPHALALARELGLGAELVPTDPRHRAVHVYSEGRLKALPQGLSLVVPTRAWPFLASDLLSWKAKLRLGLEPFAPAGPEGVDESVASFFRRRLGAEAAEKLVAPMLAGIFAGDAEALSLQSTFPQFREMERQGGLLRAARRAKRPSPAKDVSLFMTLRGGLSRLTGALAEHLPKGVARCGAAAAALRRRAGEWEITTAAEKFTADAVIAALPAPALAAVVGDFDAELARELRGIPFVSTATVTLAYEKKGFPAALDAYGFLVPRSEGRRLTAATYTSSKFPGRAPDELVLIRCFLGGAGREADAERPEEELVESARADLDVILGLGCARPAWARARSWPKANPQYNVGHAALLSRLETRLRAHPGLLLAGASYRGVGLPDCIHSGRQAAVRALALRAPEPAGVF